MMKMSLCFLHPFVGIQLLLPAIICLGFSIWIFHLLVSSWLLVNFGADSQINVIVLFPKHHKPMYCTICFTYNMANVNHLPYFTLYFCNPVDCTISFKLFEFLANSDSWEESFTCMWYVELICSELISLHLGCVLQLFFFILEALCDLCFTDITSDSFLISQYLLIIHIVNYA